MKARFSGIIFLFLICTYCIANQQGKPKIVATINILADITSHVAGEKFDVVSLLPAGTDPHTYEPKPGDAIRLARADMIITNGLHLEGWLSKLISSAGSQARLVVASKRVIPITASGFQNSYDPHAWMSLPNALLYVDEIESSLSAAFPNEKSGFRIRASRYRSEIRKADQEIRFWLNSIPKGKRHLITSHDAFRYFSRTYGFEVASIMGTSTDADVSLKDINHLIAVVRQHHVPAIFVEVAINPKILTQLAADLGIRIGGHLYTDSFGPAGSEADSYLGMMRFNALNMKNALGSVETNIPEGFAIGENLTFLLLVILAFSLAYFWVWRKVYPEYPMVANWKHYTLQIENLSVMVERKMILSNLYLQLKPGRLYGILGANGSGKSTLVKTMVGLYEPVSGTIQLDGMPIRQFLRKIAYLPQKEEFDMDFPATIEDVVRLGFFPENRGKGGLLPHQRTQMETVLHQLEIYHLKDRQIAQLSGGQFQRTLLARALCQKAEILILDEPFVGVDHATEEIIMDLLRSLVREGKMVLMVHHDLTKVRAYFDELVMINQRIVAHGPVSEVFTEENIRATYSGKVTLLQKALQLIPPRQKG